MKRPLVFAMCLCMCFSLAGCSKSGESESSSSSAEESVSASADDELLKKIDEQQKLIEEQGKKLETVEKLFNSMFGASDSDGIFSENFDFDEKMNAFNSDVHAIYDDTAVVQAYKSGDSSSLTNEKDKFILEAASKAIKDIIKDGMSDYEKEKAVYDYVFSQSHYDEGNLAAIPHTDDNSHTPYGVLHDHVAICVGNATTFKLFMDMLGIECKVIHSTEQGEHAWDLVKIEDGWYHVDITFDGGAAAPSYSQFNVTDDAKELAGYPWNRDEFPAADSVKYSFAAMNAKKIDSFYDTAALFSKAIADKKQYSFFKLKLSDTEKKNENTAVYYNSLMGEIGYQLGGAACECNGVQGFVNDGYYYGGISISYTFESDESDEPNRYDFSGLEIDYSKLYDAYLDAFGVSIDTSGMGMYNN